MINLIYIKGEIIMQPIKSMHIDACVGQIAKTVLMPGDPLRSKYIAETYLKDAVLVNNVRGVQGYTGTWKGVPVTVMASGMGMPSIGIYSWELYSVYDVDNIIRIGSAGAIQEDIKLMDIVFGQGACTTSSYINTFCLPGSFAPIADYTLLSTAVKVAEKHGVEPKIGNILSEDNFYHVDQTANDKWRGMGVMALEMEAAALYINAAYHKKRALAMCTISDQICTGEKLPNDKRQEGFHQMMELALDTAVEMAKI